MSVSGDGSDYLSHLARTGQSFIHPGGMAATAWMAEKLALGASDRVLEIGCGTGASMALLLANFSLDSLIGVEPNPIMAREARRRLGRFSGERWRVDAVDLMQWHPEVGLFDKIYCESVLCLQGEPKLRDMVAGIFGLLKPGGLFAAVETIWQEGTSQEDVDAQNREATAAFGLTMSTPMAWYAPAWSALFRETGFELLTEALLPDQWEMEMSSRLKLPKRSGFARLGRSIRNVRSLPAEYRFRRKLKAFENQPRLGETRLFLLKKAV